LGVTEKFSKKILVLAGGTGGHVMPALAVAHYLHQQGMQIHWVGTKSGIEARLVPQAGFPLSTIDIQNLRRTKSHWLLAPWYITKALCQAFYIMVRERPDVILSMGGYASGPGAIAAWLLKKPIVLHEQNAIAGWTNKIIAKFATKIMVAFPGVFPQWGDKVVQAGNPVREQIILAKASLSALPSKDKIHLLILGGSQGARILNEMVPAALALIPQEKRPEVLHQSGKEKALTALNYEKHKVNAKVIAFIEEMGDAYRWADIIICRSGALTIAEISVVGLPSILIPFPYAVDDHQTENAKYLSDKGAAFLLPQSALTPESLQNLLLELIDNPAKRLVMGEACLQSASVQATMTIAQHCLEVCRGS